MHPAYQIPLNEKELAQLGKLTVIQGQIDDEMVKTVGHHLKVDRAAANVILGSTAVRINGEIWSETIRNRTSDEDILWLVKLALVELKEIAEARNDFIHAVFSHVGQMVGGVMVYGGPEDGSAAIISTPIGAMAVSRRSPVARRVRKTVLRPISDLPAVIDRAGRLSCLVAHIHHLTLGNPATTSPWRERLVPTLPLRPPTLTPRPQGKGRKRQHGSSRA